MASSNKPDEKKVTPRSQDFAAWYNDIILRAELADYSPVRGCIVFRPDGFAIWEALRDELDRRIKKTGARNAYFPLFIPQSFLQKEAQHVEGFAPEVAVVTHGGGKELEEPLIVRPTSETIINHMFAQWIRFASRSADDGQSMVQRRAMGDAHADVPAHHGIPVAGGAHRARDARGGASARRSTMLEVYRSFVEEFLAIPLIVGRKSAAERFPGAVETYTIEGLMGDGRALQCGTSHFLGQNFAKRVRDSLSSTIRIRCSIAWQTSWGVSTRLLGAIVMAHGDDQGLRLPPTVASTQVVIVPIWRKAEEGETGARRGARGVATRSTQAGIRAQLDDREGHHAGLQVQRLGDARRAGANRDRTARRGVGRSGARAPRHARDRKRRARRRIADDRANASARCSTRFRRISTRRRSAAMIANTRQFDDYAALRKQMEGEGGGGFADIYWCGNPACETKIREETKRDLPRDSARRRTACAGKCIVCGESATERAYFAKSY